MQFFYIKMYFIYLFPALNYIYARKKTLYKEQNNHMGHGFCHDPCLICSIS